MPPSEINAQWNSDGSSGGVTADLRFICKPDGGFEVHDLKGGGGTSTYTSLEDLQSAMKSYFQQGVQQTR